MAKVDGEFAAWANEEGAVAVAEATQYLAQTASDLETEAIYISGRSVSGALVAAVEQHEATVLVLGSSSDGGRGQITIGSTADRLLHSAPVPMALAPRGYHPEVGSKITTVTCAYAETESAASVLTWTADITSRFGATLRVATFGVRGRTMFPPDVNLTAEDSVLEVYRAQATAAQEAALQVLCDAGALPPGTTHEVATGRGWVEVLDELVWKENEVLVLGSSPLGPIARVFIGSKAAKIIRHSPVPTIVIPAGVAQEETAKSLVEAVSKAAETAASRADIAD